MSNARNIARLTPNASGVLPESVLSSLSASKVSGQLSDANMSSGSIIQVVQMNIGTVTFNGDYTTGYTLSITPTNSSSTLVHYFWAKTSLINNSIQTAHDYRVQRNGTTAWAASWQSYFNRSTTATDIYPPVDFIQYDSPNSTATQTYTFQGRKYGGNQGGWTCGEANGGSGPSGSWIIMEIAA